MSFKDENIKKFIFNNNILFKNYFNTRKYFSKFKKFKKFKTVIIIGMGGSILGAKAIYSFLKYKIKKNFIFIDNLDEEYLKNIKRNNDLSKSLFLIISKSGNTNETILNSFFLKSYFKKNNTIILSEKSNNFLRDFAIKKNFFFIEHKKYIGGRYSVFTDVGMLPAYLMNLKIENFTIKLKKILKNKKSLYKNFKQIEKLKINKKKVLILFNYIPELNDFLYWSQQLFAESLGKKNKGFIPVISNAPKDHHSLLQLYLDGPKDKVFYIFSSKKVNSLNSKSNLFGESMKHLNKKKYNDIKLSQKNAFLKVLKLKKIPFREISIKKYDEKTIGKLFIYFIIETIFLANVMKINPFNQPAVEEVKQLSKKYLNLRKF